MQSCAPADSKPFSGPDRFRPGRRACPGCAKALTARLAAKLVAAGTTPPESLAPYLQDTAFSFHAFAHDPVATSTMCERVLQTAESLNAAARTAGASSPAVRKPVIAIDRRVLETDAAALERMTAGSSPVLILCLDSEPHVDALISRCDPRPFVRNEIAAAVDERVVARLFQEKGVHGLTRSGTWSYCATACPGHPDDLAAKITRGIAESGNVFLLVLTPCPTGWAFAPERTIEAARQAVSSRYFPLYEIAGGVVTLTCPVPQPTQVADYLELQKRFATVPAEIIAAFAREAENHYCRIADESRS